MQASIARFRSAFKYLFRKCVFAFLVLLSSTVYCQSDIDSLENLLTNATSSPEKLDLMLSLSKSYWSVAPAKGIIMANKSIVLAQRTNNQEKKAKAFLMAA